MIVELFPGTEFPVLWDRTIALRVFAQQEIHCRVASCLHLKSTGPTAWLFKRTSKALFLAVKVSEPVNYSIISHPMNSHPGLALTPAAQDQPRDAKSLPPGI